jgi:hypothetical protein
MSRALFLFSFFLLSFSMLSAQDQWTEGSGSALGSDNLTLAEVESLAKAKARTDAIEKVLGIGIRQSSFLQKFENLDRQGDAKSAGESFAEFVEESRQGRIIEEKKWVLTKTVANASDGSQQLKVDAQNQFLVRRETKLADANFALGLKVLKHDFVVGEKIALELTATQSCFLTIFNFSNDTVTVLFPNEVDREVHLIANTKRVIPNASYSLIASLPNGKKKSAEYLIAVATKDSLVFRRGAEVKNGSGYAQTLRAAATDMWQWLASIDADRRVETVEFLKISAK